MSLMVCLRSSGLKLAASGAAVAATRFARLRFATARLLVLPVFVPVAFRVALRTMPIALEPLSLVNDFARRTDGRGYLGTARAASNCADRVHDTDLCER